LSNASLNDAVFSESSAAIRPWPHSTCAQNRLLNVSSVRSDDSALLIVAHGSTVNPDSSAPTLAHAEEIRRRQKGIPEFQSVFLATAATGGTRVPGNETWFGAEFMAPAIVAGRTAESRHAGNNRSRSAYRCAASSGLIVLVRPCFRSRALAFARV